MNARPRRTTTLVGPNRLILGVATGGLVALASVGTALLVLTGTSSVALPAAPGPPLPRSAPLASSPGVVVLPSDQADRLAGRPTHRTNKPRPPVTFAREPVQLPVLSVAPAALAFTAPDPVPTVPTVPTVAPAPAVDPRVGTSPASAAPPASAADLSALRGALADAASAALGDADHVDKHHPRAHVRGHGGSKADHASRLEHAKAGKHAKHGQHEKHAKHEKHAEQADRHSEDD